MKILHSSTPRCHSAQTSAIDNDLPARRRRPGSSLILFGHRLEALVDKPLHTLPLQGLSCIEIALRIGGDAVHTEELARLAPAITEARHFLKSVAHQDVNFLIHAVGQEEKALLG